MKKLILLLAVAGMVTQSPAQSDNQTQQSDKPMHKMNKEAQVIDKKDVPVMVIGAFNIAHSNATDVQWKKEGTNYVAQYDMAKNESYVTYDASGNLVRTKEKISTSDLSATIMAYIKKNYGEEEVTTAYKVTDAKGTITYKAMVKDNILIFDAKGNYKSGGKKHST